MNIKNNFNFWNKFSRYLLIGISSMVLLAGGQQMILGENFHRGPDSVLADDEDDPYVQPIGEVPNDTGPAPQDTTGGSDGECPAQGCPAPPPPAPQQCVEEEQYNECISCNTSRRVSRDTCGGFSIVVASQQDAGCASWCEAPSPPPGPSCTPIDQIRTEQDCVGDQWCTFNIWRGTDCSEGRGGKYGCQRIEGRCGVSTPPPPVVSGPGSPSISGSPFCENLSPGITWNWSLPSNAETFDVNLPSTAFTSYPASSSIRSYTARNLVPGQTHNANIIVRNSAGANSQTAAVTALACGVSQPPSGGRPDCPTQQGQAGTKMYCDGRVLGYDLGCRAVEEYYSDGSVKRYDNCVSSVNSNCVGSVICPAPAVVSPPGPVCTPFSTRETECVGNQLCTFTERTRSDCTVTRSRPTNCRDSALCRRDRSPAPPGPPGAPGAPGVPGVPGTPGTPGGGGGGSVTQTVNQTVTQTVTTPAREVVREVFVGGNVGVATTTAGGQILAVKELPKTGLPVLAWTALVFIPAGFKIRRLSKVRQGAASNPSFLWEDRQFKVGD